MGCNRGGWNEGGHSGLLSWKGEEGVAAVRCGADAGGMRDLVYLSEAQDLERLVC